MAYLAQQNNQQDPNQAQAGNGAASQAVGSTQLSTTPLSTSGGSAFASGSPTSSMPNSGSPQQGQGGGDGWTNIQNYLTANQGNNASAGLLSQNANSTLSGDKSNFDSAAQNTEAAGQGQLANVNQDQASQLLGQATSQYGQSGYQGIVSQLQGMVNNSYQGPKAGDFSYGMSADGQNLGQSLGGTQGQFGSYMNGLYQGAAGPMTAGSQALQSQLDNNNQSLQGARQSALGQYNDLNSYIGSQTGNVNSDLGNYQNQYATDQAGIRNNLTGSATSDQNAINGQISNADSYMQNLATSRNRGAGQAGATVWNWSFDPTSGPNQGNVAGVDPQRTQYNTIQDVLGGSKITPTGTWDPNQANFNVALDQGTPYGSNFSWTLPQAIARNEFTPSTYQQIQNALNQPYQS